MRRIKVLLIIILFINALFAEGCWNYREIDKLAIVSGVAIDKGKKEKYAVTVETVEFSGQKEAQAQTKTLTIEGKTLFDAVRNGISLSGKRMYWSHAKTVIISKSVAEEGIVKVVDWFNRDSETREDINIMISQENTAKEILESQDSLHESKAFDMREVIDNEKSLSKSPQIGLWEFTNGISGNGIAAIAPAVRLEKVDDKFLPQIMGTAIFKKDKLIGFLEGEETKDMLFVQDKIKGSLITHLDSDDKGEIPISLEIFNSKTKVKPVINGSEISFNININTTAAIDELGGTKDFIEDPGRGELENMVEKKLKSRIEKIIKKMQNEYGADVFGLGRTLRQDKPKVWNNIGGDWENKFKDINVRVNVKIHIRNSALFSKPMKIGD